MILLFEFSTATNIAAAPTPAPVPEFCEHILVPLKRPLDSMASGIRQRNINVVNI